jgi:hypothetical protein
VSSENGNENPSSLNVRSLTISFSKRTLSVQSDEMFVEGIKLTFRTCRFNSVVLRPERL